MPTINQFQRPESPLMNLVKLGGGIADIVGGVQNYKVKQNELDKAEQLKDPSSPISQQIKENKKANLGLAATLFEKMGLDSSPIQAKIDALTDEKPIEGPVQEGQAGLGTIKNPRPLSGIEAEMIDDKTPVEIANKALAAQEQEKLANLRGGFTVEAAKQRAIPAMANLEQRKIKTQSAANNDYTRIMAPYDNTIIASNRVKELISKIRQGGLKSTPTLGNDLSVALASMFNNGKAATVYGQEHNTLDSMAASAAKRYGWVSGEPVNTITPAQLDQLDKDVQALADEYKSSRAGVYNSWKQGIDESLQPKLDQRFSTFGSDIASRTFGGNEHNITPEEAAAELARRKANKK